ncbi:serpin family protein [Brevibacterium litoralis]|uniref:serpin family protein n=1 Tax=Brevibacterium litoralis TaxID=3138935 RepID=UPI0032EB8127
MSTSRALHPIRPRRLSAALAAGATLALGLSACANPLAGAGDLEDSVLRSDAAFAPASLDQASAVPDVVDATMDLGLVALTTHAASAPGENQVLSPASILVAMSMVGEGASGATAAQIDTTLGAGGQDRTDAVGALSHALADFAGDPAVVQDEDLPERPVVHLANGVTVHEDFAVEQPYLDTLAQSYDAGVYTADLTGPEGKAVLDEWVRTNTGGLIEESAIEPNGDLRLVLQNAVLLAAQWDSPFEESSTRDAPFTTGAGAGATADIPTMHQTLTAAYTEVDGHQAVRLPYTEGFAMDVVLPAQGTGPAEIDAATWEALTADLGVPSATDPAAEAPHHEVDLALPKVDVATDLDLTDPLIAAGITDAFDSELADFSGMSTTEDLVIGQAQHQAVLTIDEEGTVAAAVTEIAMEVSAAPPDDPVEMTVDRPFLIRIVHTDTGWPLFLGAIHDPTAG